MRRRALFVALLAMLFAAVSAVPAAAAVHGPALPVGLVGIDFPSVKSIVGDVVKFFFSTLLDALVPDWLSDGSVRVIRRLVTIPNPTDRRVWPTLGRLSEGMRWIALPLLSLAVVASWVQQWLREQTGRPGSVAVVLPRTVLAALLLWVYPLLIANAVALVNSITNAMLSLPAVQDGLERTIGLVFARSLLSGSGVLLALLGIAGVLLAVGLFMLSVGLLTVFAIGFVSAPFAIACSVLDETRGVWTAWRYTLLTAALIPVGWCVLFATAGAFMVDMTSWSGGIGGTIGARFVGVFAALIILWLALRWPLMLWSSIRGQLGGALFAIGRATGSGAGGGASGAGGRAARAALQRGGLRAGSAMSGALGATRARAVTSARMALGDAGRVLARMPGAGAVGAVGTRATAAIAASVAPVAAVAASAVRPLARGAEQARGRGQAAAQATRAAYAAGSTSREAAGVGLGAMAKPSSPHSPTAPASSSVSRNDDTDSRRSRADAQPRVGPRSAADVPPAAGKREAARKAPPSERTSSTRARQVVHTRGAAAGLRGTSRSAMTPGRPVPRRPSASAREATPPERPPAPVPVPPSRRPVVSSPASRPRGGSSPARPSSRPRPKER
jgi:hypothetical protein